MDGWNRELFITLVNTMMMFIFGNKLCEFNETDHAMECRQMTLCDEDNLEDIIKTVYVIG